MHMVHNKDEDRLFVIHWLGQDYFAGWYKQGCKTVRAQRIQYPASSPFGYIRCGQANVFDV